MELNSSVTDSIFNKYCVHDFREIPELKQFIVFIDSTESWTNPWMNLQQITGNAVIDTFMSANNLTVISHVELPYDTSFGRHYVTISSPIVVNARGVVNWFKAQTGVMMAEQNITYGGAGRISISKDEGLSYLTFTNEWDDCGDGCDNATHWTYAVFDSDCTTSYFGRFEFHVWAEWSDSPETNCNIALSVPEVASPQIVSLFPNPTDAYATVVLPQSLLGGIVKVYNTLGQILKNIPIDNTTVTVDLSAMPSGIYYLSIDNNTQTVKLFKR